MKNYTYEDLEKENKNQTEIIKELQKEVLFYIKQKRDYQDLIKSLEKQNRELLQYIKNKKD